MPFLRLQRPIRPGEILGALLIVNLLWRLVWLPVSQGSYTDGLLQLSIFDPELGLTFWPPLYPLLAYALVWLPGAGLEGAARLVSVFAGAAAVIPLWSIARRLFGVRAAVMTCVAYTFSPVALRWSLQVMTDMTFTALWLAALAAALAAAEFVSPELFEQPGEKKAPDAKKGLQALLLASLAGALATLTRYQGIFLLPLFALMVWRLRDRRAALLGLKSVAPAATLAPWLLVPLWMARHGLGPIERHLGQIGERAAPGSSLQTAMSYWNLFETFVLTSPYVVTYGVFGFFLFGLFRTQFSTVRIRRSVWAALYLSLAVLALQSAFQAFQERYLLPIIPFILLIAGHGFAVWERRCKDRPQLFWALAGPALAYAALFSALVAFYQGSPFIDIKRAAAALRDAPEGVRIYSTEQYNPKLGIGAAKVAYWSGGRKIDPIGFRPLEAGDLIVLPSVYGDPLGGGWGNYQRFMEELKQLYPLEVVAREAYISYPLLPDIMQEPFGHVNPIGWVLRYQRQNFETTVLRVLPYDANSEAVPAPSESAAPAPPQ